MGFLLFKLKEKVAERKREKERKKIHLGVCKNCKFDRQRKESSKDGKTHGFGTFLIFL